MTKEQVNVFNILMVIIFGINDGAIKKILDKYRMPSVNKDTDIKKKRKEKQKIIHKFNDSVD